MDPCRRTKQGACAVITHALPGTITVAMQSGSTERVVCYMRAQGTAFPVINDQDGRFAIKWCMHGRHSVHGLQTSRKYQGRYQGS